MSFDEILNSKVAEPAAIMSYRDGLVLIVDLNDKFISEMWMNTSKEEFLNANVPKAFASDVEAALDAGMNGHIAKPFLPKDLITKISANLP